MIRPVKIAIQTTGCRTNQAESEALARRLQEKGFVIVDKEAADLYVINACALTTKAERHARNLVYRAKKANPNARVVLAGCLADRLHLFPDADFFRKTGPDLVVRNREKDGLAEKIINEFSHLKSINHVIGTNRRLLKVQEGCSRNCAYCIVPLVRGRNRSLPYERIMQDLKEIEASGAVEVVITGTHLGTYGRDIKPKTSLSRLVEDMLDQVRIPLLRISSIEPEETGMDVIGLFRHPRVAPHLHLPLQSGSDRVLKTMNRPYTVAIFEGIVHAVRKISPQIAIGNDVIVGYPTETNEDFQQTVELIQRIRPAYLHVFRYSPRPGTPAFKLRDPIPYEVKHQRSRVLTELSKNLKQGYLKALIGQVIRVVHIRERNESLLEGLSDTYVKVLYQGQNRKIAKVMVEDMQGEYLIGREV